VMLKPDYAVAHDNRGITLTELGRFDEATIAAERAIELAPSRVRSYYNLSIVRRFASTDPHFRTMTELAEQMALLPEEEQIDLHFALGKAFADVGDHERSFHHLFAGNALKRSQTSYDEAAVLGSLERTRAVFTADLLHRYEGFGEPSSIPVFILGMPRSGSTLVEQILASHPKVFGAGEISDFHKVMVEHGGIDGEPGHFPGTIPWMSADRLQQLGESYVDRLKALAPVAKRVTNKMPENFRFTGLIHSALPNAFIIHTRRDPLDTCLSCFSKLFAKDLPYTYDLAELGRYYKAYDALMTHWSNVLPKHRMLEVQYEEVVDDLEGQARRIVAHCGLEWDERCLSFYQTKRPVRTASVTQVRQPVYNSSVGRWRPDASSLAPLLDAIEC
jgi:tetratricopeptide (TPR) repeat protein